MPTDEAGTERFDAAARRTGPDRFYRFPGGCVTYDYSAAARTDPEFTAATDGALSLLSEGRARGVRAGAGRPAAVRRRRRLPGRQLTPSSGGAAALISSGWCRGRRWWRPGGRRAGRRGWAGRTARTGRSCPRPAGRGHGRGRRAAAGTRPAARPAGRARRRWSAPSGSCSSSALAPAEDRMTPSRSPASAAIRSAASARWAASSRLSASSSRTTPACRVVTAVAVHPGRDGRRSLTGGRRAAVLRGR